MGWEGGAAALGRGWEVVLEVLVGAANAMSLTNEIITAIHSFLAQWVWIVTLAIAMVVWSMDRESAGSRAEVDS